MPPHLVAIALVAAIGVSACSEPQFGSSVGAPLSLAQFPRMKEGLWRETMTMDYYAFGVMRRSSPPIVTVSCDAANSLAPAQIGVCDRFALGRLSDGGYAADFSCRLEGDSTKGRAIIRGDFGGAFSETSWTDESTGRSGRRVDFVYLGACPAGMKPRNWADRDRSQ